MIIGELTSQHYGQIIHVQGHNIYLMKHQDLGIYRRKRWIGLSGKDFTGKFVRKEYRYTAETPCLITGPWRQQ